MRVLFFLAKSRKVKNEKNVKRKELKTFKNGFSFFLSIDDPIRVDELIFRCYCLGTNYEFRNAAHTLMGRRGVELVNQLLISRCCLVNSLLDRISFREFNWTFRNYSRTFTPTCCCGKVALNLIPKLIC